MSVLHGRDDRPFFTLGDRWNWHTQRTALESCKWFVQHHRTENPSLDEHPGSNPGSPTYTTKIRVV